MSNNNKQILEMVKKYGNGLVYCEKCQSIEFKGWQYVIMRDDKIYLATKTQKELIEKLHQIV